MSTFKVLQNCPSQKQVLLSTIGGIEPADSNLVAFNHKGFEPQLPAQLAFLIQVKALNKTVHLAEVATVETCHMISSTSTKMKKNSEYFDSVDHHEVSPPSPTIPTSSDDQFSDVVHYVLGALEPYLSFMTPYQL